MPPRGTPRPLVTARYAVRCPDCKGTFETGRAALDAELACPRCGNKGFVAPGNHPQLSDAQVDMLTDEQLEQYLRYGFHVLDPRRKPEWGTGAPVWSRAAGWSVLATVAVFLVAPVASGLLERGAPHIADHPATPWLGMLMLSAGPVGMVVFGHLASRHRSGKPGPTWTILGVGWLVVVVLGLAFASSLPRLLCSEQVTSASWQEPGAADALRGLGLGPPRGDPSLPFPGDEPPYLSALMQMEHAGTKAYYTVRYDNASSAWLRVHPNRGVAWNETAGELAGFIEGFTGKTPLESKRLADDFLAGRLEQGPGRRIAFVSAGGSPPESTPTYREVQDFDGTQVSFSVHAEPGTGRIDGPFRTAAFHEENRGKQTWFVWTWATHSMTIRDQDGESLGTIDYQGTGFVVARLHGTSEAAFREATATAFAEARLPPPTFTRMHMGTSSCD